MIMARKVSVPMEVETLEGPERADVGDYIVERLVFDYRVMKKEDFDLIYEHPKEVTFPMSRRKDWVIIPEDDYWKFRNIALDYLKEQSKKRIKDEKYLNGLQRTLDETDRLVEKWKYIYAEQELRPAMEKVSDYLDEVRKKMGDDLTKT